MNRRYLGCSPGVLGEGGSGCVIRSPEPNFLYKVVFRMESNGSINHSFWNEAESVQTFYSHTRFITGAVKIPASMQFAYSPRPGDPEPMDEPIRDLRSFGKYYYLPPDVNTVEEAEALADDLVLFYPIYRGKTDLGKIIERSGPLPCSTACRVVYYILNAIAAIHGCKLSHGDIKPSNIMALTDGLERFALTDYGIVCSENVFSTEGTEAFMPNLRAIQDLLAIYNENELVLRQALDCYALAAVIICMGTGQTIPRWSIGDRQLFERWRTEEPLLSETLFTIYRGLRKLVCDYSGEGIKKLADLAVKKIKINGLSQNYGEYRAYHGRNGNFCPWFSFNGGEIGAMAAQIILTDRFDPLWKFPCKKDILGRESNLPAILHRPVAYSDGRAIMHAPDNYMTGEPPRREEVYIAATLENSSLKKADKQSLLDALTFVHSKKSGLLFAPEDVVMVNNVMKLAYLSAFDTKVPLDIEVMQKMLLDRRKHAFLSNLKKLLQTGYGEVDEADVIRLGGETLLHKLVVDHPENCLEFVQNNPKRFYISEWNQILEQTPLCDSYVPAAMAEELVRIGSAKTVQRFLENLDDMNSMGLLPAQLDLEVLAKIAKLRRDITLPESMDIPLSELLNEESLTERDCFHQLIRFPDEWELTDELLEKFSAGYRDKFIMVKPADAVLRLSPEMRRSLDKKTWVRILGSLPELFNECPYIDDFRENEWCSILLQQPQLKKYCTRVTFSEKSLRRLAKKSIK